MLSPILKGCCPSFQHTWISVTQLCFVLCVKFRWNWSHKLGSDNKEIWSDFDHIGFIDVFMVLWCGRFVDSSLVDFNLNNIVITNSADLHGLTTYFQVVVVAMIVITFYIILQTFNRIWIKWFSDHRCKYKQ